MATKRSHPTLAGQPAPRQDRTIRLCVNYFFVCRETREILARSKDEYDAAVTTEDRERIYREGFGIHMRLWLASLFPVCDGFRKLGLKDAAIEAAIGSLMGSLRLIARNVSSYQDDDAFQIGTGRFLGQGDVDMNAAEQLFQGFERFFSAYLADAGVLKDNPRRWN